MNWNANLHEQEPNPKTEDQVEEDAEVLLQLGTDTQGVEMRAHLMSASLLSDMESFKVLLGQEVV
jgi:Rab3 GTPase-activating protein catalytic subunit